MHKHASSTSRSNPIALLALLFLCVSSLLRAALMVREWQPAELEATSALRVLGLGFLADVRAGAWILLPLALYLAFVPGRILRWRAHAWLTSLVFFVAVALLLFEATAEWFFWDEFQARLNFIAVDYLAYTNEVLGNIVESYPLGLILSGLAALSLTIVALLRRRLDDRRTEGVTPEARFAALTPVLLVVLLDLGPPDSSAATDDGNRYAGQLGKNGLATLVGALWNPVLDYPSFYRCLPEDEAFARMRGILTTPETRFATDAPRDVTRIVETPREERDLNVVLVVVESLSASFLGCYGSPRELTPELDRLAADSLVFDDLYATGSRTVRGLEALSLSVPPTPGRSILRRDSNANLSSMGFVFRDHGYDARFVYGGYGYFDEMNSFFSGNGFEVVDRADFDAGQVRFANTWGVSDEDLYQRVIGLGDESHAAGRPFFSMVMTTSNHTPYTYPDVIEIPSGTGRKGAVRYSDHAIGRFMQEARERPWFAETLFVFVADHCASSAGKSELDLAKHHIPLLVYAPGIVAPGHVRRVCSQIDVAPTIFGLLGFDYASRSYGNDILAPGPERALIGNYQTLGLYSGGTLTQLTPGQGSAAFAIGSDFQLEPQEPSQEDLADTIAYYQTAASLYESGGLARVPTLE